MKNIKIDDLVHNLLKTYCAKKNLKIYEFVNEIISSRISEEENANFGNQNVRTQTERKQ